MHFYVTEDACLQDGAEREEVLPDVLFSAPPAEPDAHHLAGSEDHLDIRRKHPAVMSFFCSIFART